MQNNQKQYGLIKLGKGVQKPIAKPSIFGSDSESDNEELATTVQYESSNLRKQTQSKISKAIEQDPNIFQYDEVYEEMKSATTKPTITKTEKKPRYMTNLLKTAELRKKENELRQERKIQKEREQEGDEFNDKEAFVTSAYREKLEEMKKEQEDAEYQEARENMLDVTKQNNLNGFYRSLYKNAMFNNIENESTQENVTFNKKTKDRKKTNLRERNLDDENDDQDEGNDSDEMQLEKDPMPIVEQSNKESQKVEDEPKSEQSEEKSTDKKSQDEEVNKEENTVAEPVKAPKLTRDEIIQKIFTKRTVSEVFDEARKRYLERKSALTVT